jgi:hypothetical protein
MPGGVAVDSAGNVYVADIFNHRITKGTPEAAVDMTPPVITCPAPVLVSNDGQCHAVAVTFENPTVTDDCDHNPTVSCDHQSGDLFPVGTTVVTCTATDAHGNSSTCSFTVTVSNDKAITSDFNGTSIPGNSTVWFNAVIKMSGLSAINGPVTVKIINQKITSSKFSLPVPDATVILDPNATCATTTCNGSGNWTTVAPNSGLSGNTFLSGFAYKLPAGGLPGGIKPVTWSGTFVTDTAGITLQWKWAAAVYNSSANLSSCSAIGVKATDDTKGDCTYKNSDAAGTPENVKSGVMGGARGGGGSNYTGALGGALTVAPCDTF